MSMYKNIKQEKVSNEHAWVGRVPIKYRRAYMRHLLDCGRVHLYNSFRKHWSRSDDRGEIASQYYRDYELGVVIPLRPTLKF